MTKRHVVAFHEAGHAVIAWRYHLGPGAIEITNDGGKTLTEDKPLPDHPGLRRAVASRLIAVLMGGDMATQLMAFRRPQLATEYAPWMCRGAEADIAEAVALAERAGEPKQFVGRIARRVGGVLLRSPTWEALELVATTLYDKGELSGEEVVALIKTLKPPRAPKRIAVKAFPLTRSGRFRDGNWLRRTRGDRGVG